MVIKSYKLKSGQLRYRVIGYLGQDPLTNQQVNFHKQGFKTKQEARNAYNQACYEFDKGAYGNLTKDTYRDVYELWKPLYKQQVKESTFAKSTGRIERYIIPLLGKYKLSEITPAQCQNLAEELSKIYTNYKAVYCDGSRIFEFAINTGMINANNPFKRTILPKPHKKIKREKILELDDIFQLLNLLKTEGNYKWYVFYHLLSFTGLRRGEALALYWTDIDFKAKTLSVSKTITIGLQNKEYLSSTPKTSAGYRTISLDQNTCSILLSWKKVQDCNSRSNYVFENASGSWTCLSTPYNYLSSFCKKHGLKPIDNHIFRHTHCSMLFEAGWSLKDVQKRMGHSDIKTTLNIYTHVTKKQHLENMRKLEKYINGK